jgi:hypothetical protein
VINLATFWIYVTHDNKLCNKSKKFTSIFNNKLCKESLWIRLELSENCFHSVVVKIILINYAKKNQTYSCLGWCESTKWISWKEFAQTGREKVCDTESTRKALHLRRLVAIFILTGADYN